MNAPLEDQIREYYQSQSLSEDSLKRIETALEEVRPETRRRTSRFQRPAMIAAAAVLVLGVFVGGAQIRKEMDTRRVVVEIAQSHRKALKPEFQISAIPELQAVMDRLDFSLLPVADTLSERFEISGARYCSVGGQLAAQLRVRERKNQTPATLYVASLTPKLNRTRPCATCLGDVTVELWDDGARYYGLAWNSK
tara:strand:- start:2211 stop:2795 length:585 start_codon:yes stop_codon:yes gene_type:complete